MESKKVNLPEIDKIVKASLDAVHEHKILIKSMHEFANQFEQMVKNECPEFSEKSKIIAAFIRGAMDQETIIASAEERMAEDLNDLSARYEVLLRLGSEIQNKRSQAKNAIKKIAETERAIEMDKLSGSKKTPKLQGDLYTYNRKKSEYSEQLKDLLEQFIEARQRYAKFKIRRLQNGFVNLGTSVKSALEIEKHLFVQMSRECQASLDNIDEIIDGEKIDLPPLKENQEQNDQAEQADENEQLHEEEPETKEENGAQDFE